MVDVEVTFEYAAEQEDELNIKVGDIIKNVTMSEGGWWEGELNGKVGMFPDNFVKVIEKPKPTKVKEDQPAAPKKDINKHRGASVRELASKIKDDVHVGMGAPKKKETHQNTKRKKAKVVFSYEPENADELKLEVGNIVEVLKQEEEGWWEGSLDGKVGVFPSNFVEEIEESEPEKTPEEKPSEAPVEGKKKVIGGVGLGNIFEGGPIKLKSTNLKNTDKASHSPPDPVVRHIEEEKSHAVTKREKPGLYVRPPIPTPRLSQACTPTSQTSKSSTSNRKDGSSCHLASEDSSYSDLVGRDMPKSEDSWVSVLFGDQDSDDGISNEEVQIVLDLDSDQNRKDALIPIRSQQLPSYTILTGLDKLSVMQLMDQKDMIEENLIEYADVEVDEENKENVMLERKCVSAIASLGNTGSRTSVLGTTHNHNSSNNNSSEDLKVQSRSIDSFRLNIEKQKTENPLKNSRVESWLSKEVQPSTAHGKRKESLFKRVMKLDMFRKRSKSVMPFIEKETNGKLTQRVPSLAELCRIILKSDLTAPGRTPLMEITATHLNQRYDPDQSSGAFEVSVDSLESAGGSVETAHEKRMNAIYQLCSDDDDDESLLNLLMGREDDGNDCSIVDKHTEADSLQRSRDDTSDKIAKDSYLGSLNRTGQLSPFIRMIASRYHLFDPETQKWKEGYMDGPGHLDLYGSSAENIHPDEQTSVSPVAEEGVASITPPIEDDHHDKESSVLSSYNVLPPGSVREKVLHFEHMYVNELVDQVIEQTMHGLCLEQCIEELGSLGHHPELRRRLINEYIGTNISDCQRSEGEITPSDSEIYVDGSEGEILTPKISDGDISSESDDGHVESSKICQKSQIEDSLYSAVTDVADTDYATAVSDMDTDGSYVVSFLSNADLDSDISGLDTKEQPTLNASGEYVDLPEQLSYYNGRYSCHSKPMMCENPVLSEQKNMDGPWVSPVNTRLRIGLGACPRKDTGFHDSPDCRLYTPRCSIGTQTPEMVNHATSDDDKPRNKSFGGKTEDRGSSPIKELLSYDTTLEDSLDTSVVVTPAKVRPRYSSSPIKTYEEEEDRQSKRKLDETSDHQAEVISLSQNDKSKKSKTSSQDVNTGKTFDVSDCTEKRRKRFSWKKMFHSKPKEPAVLISFRRRSDKEMEEDLIKDSVIPQVTKDDVAMESNATIPADCSNNAVCENQPDQVNPIIIYKTRPFSEDLNTVETFFSHEQSINLSLYRIHEDSRHGSKSSQEPVTDNLIHDSINDEEESDIEKYSLCDMEIDEEKEQARIDMVRDTKEQCEQCDLSDLHIHGQRILSHGTVQTTHNSSPLRLETSLPKEYSDDEGDSEGVSLDSPNISPSLAIAIRNNVITTPDSPEVNLDSFLQEALRPIDDLLDESSEGVELEDEDTPRLDGRVFTHCMSETPEKYPGFTYISPSMENIMTMYKDDSLYKPQNVPHGQGDELSTEYNYQSDTSNLSLEYVLSLEKKFKEELGSPELKDTPQNTPQLTPETTPRNASATENVERYPSFTLVGEDTKASNVEESSPVSLEKEVAMSNLSSSVEGLYDYEDSFESSDSEEESQKVKDKEAASVDESEEIEEVIEVEDSLDQSSNDSSWLNIPSFQDSMKCDESYLMYGSDTERIPSFMSDYMHSTPAHYEGSAIAACALPTLEEQGPMETEVGSEREERGRSSYSFVGPEPLAEDGLSDSGLLLSFGSSPDNSSSTINV